MPALRHGNDNDRCDGQYGHNNQRVNAAEGAAHPLRAAI
jgi:hypothetical protein